MEAMGAMGFVFGLTAFALATAAKSQLGALRNEFEELKKSLENSGVLQEKTNSEDT